ncbi:MAG: clp protease binding subunit, partial [Candidatus Saccharibacteria bacterium]|nr:clp protease binding subunit [Candidatus Saccharibacteria bacterium]
FAEAAHAGNIIVALDEAQLFFGQGTGAVNLSQVLLPVMQSKRIKLVLAVTPGDWQRLMAMNSSMASLLTPLMLAEAPQAEVMRVLGDRALLLENGKAVTTYAALLEAYRLSGRYFQEESYPGRAIKLLEAAHNFPDGAFISERSVQQAIESQFGVKVGATTSAESDVLLNLEDKIHQRMINQTRAVSVVSNALRRARAGVSNPRRPIGSFLFLGPTGVGKTELARSLAALYFGAEDSVIRLDMSEYQQVADVDRILQGAAENPQGLLPKVRSTPFSVVLFDEIEKAHPNILNLFLQLLDEGNLTDTTGKPASFKDAIVIATSNAGADEIRKHIEAGEELESFEQDFVNNLISSGSFKPELLNRFDEIVLFRPLKQEELGQVVKLMISEVNKTIANQKITVQLADDAIAELVKAGYDPRLGARPMRRMVQRRVEDAIAGMILRGEAKPGDNIMIDAAHLGPNQSTAAPAAPTSVE